MIRCSEWCGGGCTQEQYETARRHARVLAKRLGAGWKPVVNENMGWHWSVVSQCGRLKVHGSTYATVTRYTAFLGAPGPGGKWAQSANAPEIALNLVMAEARRELARLGGYIRGLPVVQTRARSAPVRRKS
jgi:hypothetical protein